LIDIIRDLKRVMAKKQISPETAAHFIGVSGKEIRRWFAGEYVPNLASRQAIRRGIREIQKNL